MKIIEPGKKVPKKKSRTFIAECDCGCKFKFNEHEGIPVKYKEILIAISIRCPNCYLIHEIRYNE